MGVKGLWKIIESAGVPVPLETLEHKVLGVDVSIWLHQAVRGFRGPGGAAVANAHLLTLFHRICKLLFYRIRPVFVFDGGVPYLKKQTLASRKLKREVATNKARQVRERLLKNLLKSQAVRNALGKSGPGPSSVHVPQVTKKEKDLFELPPLPEGLTEETTDDQEGRRTFIDSYSLPNLHHFDYESEEFKNMSLDMKHEILSELQGTRKQNSWATINDMPQQSESFADFQMARLMKRAKFQATLDSTREEIRKSKVSEMEEELFGDLEKYVSLSRRIVSEDASHAIFVKKATDKNDSKNRDEELDRKGKSPLKKKKPLGKDFLTELAKVGIIQHNNSDSNGSDDECENYYAVDEKDWSDTEQQNSKIEEESFLHVVGSLMENSGLTQDEILSLIKQDQRENVDTKCTNAISDGPSTSANASGSIYNPDADSSDDDEDFIEVTSDPQPPQEEEKGDKKDDAANNIEKLLGTKTNSLWMKIVQQKVDDMVHVNTLKSSPNKAIIDSRKIEKENVSMLNKTPKEGSETLKPVKISLDFEVKPLKMEDNIFSDIFTDFVSQSESKKVQVLSSSNQESIPDNKTRGTINSAANLNLTSSQQDNAVKNCVEKCGSLPSWSGRCEVLDEEDVDDVQLMSSSDDSDDDEPSPSSISQSSPTKSKSQKSSSGISEHKNTDTMDSLSPEVPSHDKGNTVPSSSSLISKDRAKTETTSMKTVVHNGKSPRSAIIELPKAAVPHSENPASSEQVLPNGLAPADPATKRVTPFSKKDYIIDENITSESMSAGDSTVEGSLKEGANTADTTEHNGTQQNTSEVTLLSRPLDSDNSPETIQKKSMNKKHTTSVSQMETETNSNIPDDGDDGKDIASTSVTKEAVIDCTLESTSTEGKLQTGTDGQQEEEVFSSVEEIEMEDDEIERPFEYNEDELKHLEEELASEQQALVAQAQQSERVAASLNDQMYGEAQYLLQLFGIPYLVAPMEAEAQCAFLNSANLSEGTITDDSDIFLFGGNSVYRNFFNQTRHVEHFKVDNIKSTLGLDRSKMITLALLSGSDYTEGIEGIGSVSGMEILTEFSGEGIECLKNLKKWWNAAHKSISSVQPSKIRQKLLQVALPDSFPNESVFEAYQTPEVDESKEKFSWAVPNVEALRKFTGDKFGWNRDKADEILLPVMKKLKLKTSQKRIESYFTSIKLVKDPKVTSKRMQEAIAKAKGIKLPASDNSSGKSQAGLRQRKKKVAKNTESEPVTEEGVAVSETVQDAKSSTPRRTLLVDPSEIVSKSVTESKRGRKRKKDSNEEDGQSQKSEIDSKEPHHSDTQNTAEESEVPKKKLTKEDMFKSLLEKETICQREKDRLEMQEKKMAAAQILQKQKKGKTKKR